MSVRLVALTRVDLEVLQNALCEWRTLLDRAQPDPEGYEEATAKSVLVNHCFDLQQRLSVAARAFSRQEPAQEDEANERLPF